MNEKILQQHIGEKIRIKRTELGLTQSHLAKQLGVSFQQTHKYEKGLCAITATRLFALAKALGVEVGYFYTDLPGHGTGKQKLTEPLGRANLEVARNFQRIKDAKCREALSLLCKAIADDYP